ncbi:MAG: molybdate ABC transporter substrate-binding protein [Candidatus Velthaea sp.]
MRINSIRATAFIAAATLLGSAIPAPAPAAESGEVIALVASNAKGAFTELIKQFETKHKGVKVTAQYLGGAKIGKMIDENEPADVVLVGRTVLEKELQLIDPPTPVLRNKDILLVPKDNPAKIASLKDLANPGVKLSMGTPTSAVGVIASKVLQNAAADYGFEFIQNTRKNLSYSSDKGSDVVDALNTGKADVALTFASDVNPAKFKAIEIEDKYNVVSTYAMTVPKNSKNAALGKDFVAMVAGPQGQATLRKFHYMSPQ